MSAKPKHITTKNRYGIQGRRRIAAELEREHLAEIREAVKGMRK